MADTVQSVRGVIGTSLLLNANDRLHRMAQARKTSELVQVGRLVFGRHLRPVTGRTRVVVTFSFPDDKLGRSTASKRRDVANWAPTAKALVDGMTLAGVWPDDSTDWVVGPDLRVGKEPAPALHAVVWVTLEPDPEAVKEKRDAKAPRRQTHCAAVNAAPLVVDGREVGEVRYFCTLPVQHGTGEHVAITSSGELRWKQ